MDIDAILQVVRPIVGVFGLLVFTHGLGRLVATPTQGHASRDAQIRKATMLSFWIFFFVYFLEPRPFWAQLALLLVAVFYLAAVFSAPLRRMLFRPKASERDAS